VIPPEEVEAFLLPLPVGRLPGVGKVNEAKLAKLGVTTVSELRIWSEPTLNVSLAATARVFTNWPAVSTRIPSYQTDPCNPYRSKTLFQKISC